MVEVYVNLIKNDLRSLEQVPKQIREQVRRALESEDISENKS